MLGEPGENCFCELVQVSGSIFRSFQRVEDTGMPVNDRREYIRYKQQKGIMNLRQRNQGLIAFRQLFDLRSCESNVFLYRTLNLIAFRPRTSEFAAAASSLVEILPC